MNTLEKCVKILSLFAEGRPVFSVAEIASRVGIPKSTIYRHIAALKVHGLLEEDVRTGDYRLGGKILELAASARRRGLVEIALPIMESLSKETGETFILAGLNRMKGICLERVEGHHALRVSHERGAVFPLHAGASGKVLLAHLDQGEQKRIIEEGGLPRFSPTTITDKKTLLAELLRIKDQGYATSAGEVIAHTYGVAGPIFASTGKILAALTVSAPAERLAGARRREMIRLVVEAAKAITREVSRYDVH